MPHPVAVAIELSDEERVQLEAWTRRRTSAQALAQRSRIVLLAAEGLKNTEIAERLGVSRATAAIWRTRFAEHRLDGLLDAPRPGRPRTIADDKVEEVIVRTLETTPKDATHWSTRSMAREVGLTQSAVLRIWRAFGLQPHRQQTWKLSRDPRFIAKVRAVVGLYLNPSERAVVLCVDEKSQIQALDRTAPVLPMLPGTPERATHDYKRSGTASLYAALDLTTGRVIGRLHGRHRAIEFKQFLATIDREVPAELDVPHRARQLLHAQDAGDPALAGRSPTLRLALHPDQLVVAEPRRALVRRADDQEAAPRSAPLRPRPQRRHPRLDQHLERQSQALRLDQDRRPDPRLDRPLLRTNQRITTLVLHMQVAPARRADARTTLSGFARS
jgi:transposase